MAWSIDNMRQNHPELIVRDLAPEISPERVRRVLKCRGVNKWLRVRRLLIQLKHRWLHTLHAVTAKREMAKREGNWRQYHQLGGYLKALAECRQQVRALCHSPRDVAFPANPRDFGNVCELPEQFPVLPPKRWFLRHDREVEQCA